ncbi:MAG: GntR family transcriptional regulator [Proteobacteria bacterium]|nr:GntR family transcriptional regulator [Pseudomonadota bacterium]
MSAAALARIARGLAGAEEESDFPRYRQIIDALVRAIERGTLSPGDRLPPETKLAKLFSVSLGTIQKALAHLANGGFLQRTRRRGTFVAGRRAEDVFVFRFRNPETGEVLVPFTRVLSVTEDRSDGPWRKFLRVERCVLVERLVWVEGDSPAFSQFRISREHGKHLLDEPIEALHGVSFHRILGRKFNLPTVRTSHRLQCRKLGREVCRHLLVPEGTYGTVWDVVGYSYQQATTYQSLHIPAGHRPIELDAATVAPQRQAA